MGITLASKENSRNVRLAGSYRVENIYNLELQNKNPGRNTATSAS